MEQNNFFRYPVSTSFRSISNYKILFRWTWSYFYRNMDNQIEIEIAKRENLWTVIVFVYTKVETLKEEFMHEKKFEETKQAQARRKW